MAAIFASKRNQKKGSSLGKAPSHQFRPVLNSTQCSRDRLGSSTETRVKGEVTHVRRQQCLLVCDYVKARGQPREPLHRVSKQELGDQVISATAPPSTRPIRHGQAWTRSSLQHESPSKQPPSLQSSREVDHDSELDSSFDMDSSTPPSPSDLEALRETWEQVRLHNTKISKFTPAPSRTRFSWSEDGMLRPRGGGINFGMTAATFESRGHSSLSKIGSTEVLAPRNIRIQAGPDAKYLDGQILWRGQRQTALGNIKYTGIQKQLEDDGIWMCEETAITTPLINDTIETLKLEHPTVEAEWSIHFWQEFFFRRGNGSRSRPRLLIKCVERRQLHSESYKDAKTDIEIDIENDPEDRFPRIIADRRYSVAASAAPWIMTKFNRRGYAFSDILYAATIPVDLTSADDIQRYPVIRLFRDPLHLGAGLTVEIKPLDLNGMIGNEKKEHAIRYSTLTASIMLHEQLKLYYLASDDDEFFPADDYLSNHFIAAVGYIAYHFIHCLRYPRSNQHPGVIYESYLLNVYDLSDFSGRKTFRQTMNIVYVYQIEVVREVELARLRSIHALDPETREHRLKTRTHKYIRFSHEKRGDVEGFKVYDDSPDNEKSEHSATHHAALEETAPALDAENLDDQTQKTTRRERRLGSSTNRLKGPSEPVLPLRIRPRGPKPKPAHSHPTGPNIQPSSLPSYMKPTASNTSKAHLQKRTRDGRLRCQAWLKERHAQCENASREEKMACGIPAHQASVKDQLAHTPRLPHSVSLSPVNPSRDSQ